MAIEGNTLKLTCSSVQLMKEHGVTSNLVTLYCPNNNHDVVRFEEFASESAFAVGRAYEVTIKVLADG